jgi:hypothetical protein
VKRWRQPNELGPRSVSVCAITLQEIRPGHRQSLGDRMATAQRPQGGAHSLAPVVAPGGAAGRHTFLCAVLPSSSLALSDSGFSRPGVAAGWWAVGL